MFKAFVKLNNPWVGVVLAALFLISGTVLLVTGHDHIGSMIVSALVGVFLPQPFRVDEGDE